MVSVKERIFGKKSIYLNADGTPKTIDVSGRNSFSLKGLSPFKRNRRLLETYWKYYQGEGTIFASINTTAWNTIMVGYRLDSDNEDAKKLIETRFNEMDIDGVLLDNTIYALVYGDAFIEKVMTTGKKSDLLDKYIPPSVTRLSGIMKPNSKDYKYPELRKCYEKRLEHLEFLQSKGDKPKGYISYVKTVDPVSMQAIINKNTGEKIGYKQDIPGRKTPDLELDEIIQIGFFPQANSPYHISLIGPSKDTIDRMVDVDQALHQATIRHGTPKYHVVIGTKDEPLPPKEVYTSVKNDMDDIYANNEFTTPAVIDIKTLDEKGVPNVNEYANLFQKKAIVGIMCPEESIGMSTGGSTEATASVREIMFERYIQTLQHKLATKIRTELINPLLIEAGFEENIVHMKFRSVTTKDEEGFAKWLGNLLRGFQFSKKKPITINEIRDMLHLQPIEGGDDLEWGGEMESAGTNIQPSSD